MNKILRINLSSGKISKEEISHEMKIKYIGGRGFAIRTLWEEVQGVDPLKEDNKIVFSTGPLTGLPLPSSGKMVIASKSPLTGGYGDSSIGTKASMHLKKTGYDMLIVEGKAKFPSYIFVENDEVKICDAKDLWGKGTFEAQDFLEAKHGQNTGILLIGPAGERMVRFASIISQKGRAAGRTGMGAVMGSKNLKGIVMKGNNEIPLFDAEKLKALGKGSYGLIRGSEGITNKDQQNYDFWLRQGTMATVEWGQENGCLPAYNYREGTFKFAKQLDGYAMEKIKIDRKGCPLCIMQCGNIVKDAEGKDSELDYENVVMLGSVLGLKDLKQISTLVRFADDYGLDAISLGSCLGFLMEASEKGLISDGIAWGDYEGCKRVIKDIINNRGNGAIVFEGTLKAAQLIGGNSKDWAMQVKGMEISAYDCHGLPGMALAFGTSPVGGHHRDAWMAAYEIGKDRFSYGREKVEKLIEMQRWRGGMFEALTVCRFPWVELNLVLTKYLEFLEAATGLALSDKDIFDLGDRFYALMRAYWVREKGIWDREMDVPPARWFNEPLKEGNLKGIKLDKGKYVEMLSMYYELRGWDANGIPKKETFQRLGLGDVVEVKRNG
jgi:aldehyde:ferredoxin oxidoreductase